MNQLSILLLIILVSATTQFKIRKNIDQSSNILAQVKASTNVKTSAGTVDKQAPYPFFMLKARHSNLCMNILGAGIADGVNINQIACANVNSQKFMVR
jgi:hypothetical protein